jgi:hypothetical protein
MNFGMHLKAIGDQFFAKQYLLAYAVGLSGAAISYWVTGAKRPSPASMARLLTALRGARVPEIEIVSLYREWENACRERRTPSAAACLTAPRPLRVLGLSRLR